MPRNRRAPVMAAVIPTPAMVAGAIRYTGKAPAIYRPTAEWQREAYRHYEICGEARFAAQFFGHALSRMVLRAAKKTPNGPEVVTSGPAYDRLDELFAGKLGQAQMLQAIGVHLAIAGECFLVGRTLAEGEGDESTADSWEVVSCLEMKVQGSSWAIHYGEKMRDIPLDLKKDVVIRIWTPHPAVRIEADSPFRSLLPVLTEIEWLTKHIFKQVSSRLTAAGILFLSQGLTYPAPPDHGGEQKQLNDAEQWIAAFGEYMMEPLTNPEAPSSAIPFPVMVPEEVMRTGKIAEYVKFWSELDANAKTLRDDAVKRFALGMDLPPEAVLGMSSNRGTGGGSSSGVSHWGAWQIEESTIKMHIEPMAEVVVNALIIGYLRPLTEDVTDLIVYDSTALKLRPDRSKESLELNDRGLLKDEVTLRENGFEATDMMDDDERHQWLLRKIAGGSATPDQVGAALKMLGVDLQLPPQSPAAVPTRESRPSPSLEDHPTRPRTPEAAALLAASDALVFRALERVGNRIRQKGVRPPGVASYETHTLFQVNGEAKELLEDAWSCAPQVLDGIADVDTTIETLNAYVRALFAERAPHSRERLATWLEAAS